MEVGERCYGEEEASSKSGEFSEEEESALNGSTTSKPLNGSTTSKQMKISQMFKR